MSRAGGPGRRKRAAFLAVYFLCATIFVLGSLEIFLRFYVHYNPSYYTGFTKPAPGQVARYPYGIVKWNSLGFPDDEFSALKSKPRIGYFGDSICIGVGAGYGYRISELLERKLPQYEHMNFGQIGEGFTTADIPHFLELIGRFQVDKAVYLMNLNDVLPDQKRAELAKLSRMREAMDWLRGQSYLYTHVRMLIKNQLVRMGYEQTGQKAYELYPNLNDDVFRETCARVRKCQEILRSRGVDLIVVILPYEMQISQEAERTYRKDGVRWEEDFVDRGPQAKLLGYLRGLTCLDAYWAFVDAGNVNGSRQRNPVGGYFVYNQGDKLDWNHPNREGHRLIAEFIGRSGVLSGDSPSAGSSGISGAGQDPPPTSPRRSG